MTDMICRKSMVRYQTPGMCAPHGGCSTSALVETGVRYGTGTGATEITDQEKLKVLADRVMTDRRFCVDEHHRNLAEGVLALLAENEVLLSTYKTMLCAAHELGLPVDAGAQQVVDAIHALQVRNAELRKNPSAATWRKQ